MISRVGPFGRTVAVTVLALSLFAGSATAGQSCGSAVIRDWYDNEKFDRSWNCDCMLDGLTLLPEDGRRAYLSARD